MIKRQAFGFTVHSDKNNYKMLWSPTDCEYPETKEEGVQVLISSTIVIIKELHYMLGCIYCLKAPLLRPNSKKKWFDVILKIVDDMDEIRKMLRIHPSQEKQDPSIPF